MEGAIHDARPMSLGSISTARRGDALPSPIDVGGRVARFALPATAVMLLSSSFLVVDTYFVARLGEEALAGVTLVFPLYLVLLTVLGGGIGVGLSVVISVRLGRGDREAAQQAVGSALALAVGLAVLSAAVFFVAGRWLFERMSSSAGATDAAMSFAISLFAGAPILAVSLTMTNLLRSEKKLAAASGMMLVGGVVNACLDPLLIEGRLGLPALGVAGAGVATVLGFTVTMAIGWLFFGGAGRLSLRLSALRLTRADVAEIVRIALPTIATYAANNAVLLVLTATWARFGTHALAGFGLTSRLEYLLVLGLYGFGGAILTLGGEAWGAGERRAFARVSAASAGWAVVLTSVVAIAVATRPASWLGLFDAPPATIDAGARYLRIAAWAYPLYALGLTLNYSYQTIARAHQPLVYVLVRGFGVAVPGTLIATASGAAIETASAAIASSFAVYGLLSVLFLRRAVQAASQSATAAARRDARTAGTGRRTAELGVARVSPTRLSPYPLSYTWRWPWYFWRPSLRNHLRLVRPPRRYARPGATRTATVRVCALGDIMVMQQDRIPVLPPELIELLAGADVILGCCEAPVARAHCDPDAAYSFSFNMPAEYLRGILEQSGAAPETWHLSVANNHAGDAGAAGLLATMESLTALGVRPLGYRAPGRSPLTVVEHGSLRIGLAAWTNWLNLDVFDASYGVWRWDDVAAFPWRSTKRELRLDCLVTSAHWEYEWQHFPRRESRRQAESLQRSGFDLIVGSHPHVLQPLEWFDDTLCIYSLGNFCSGLGISWPARMSSVLTLDIAGAGEHRGKVVGYELHLFAQVNEPERIRLVPVREAPRVLRERIEARTARIYGP